ncbi:MAG TPA: hypothetical protein VLR90_04825 [Blastocatellia bacterium]|nr:hypothetical protein [Blastocatellia bacterium]
MATEQEPMVVYDNYKSPLTAGSYRFVLQQTVKVGDKDKQYYYRDQRFEVMAPRYAIEGSEIQTYFPPPGGIAEYKNILPHVVLRTRNLPWERRVWPDEGGEPWLALLVLSEQDILEGDAVTKTGTIGDLAPEQPAEWIRKEGGATVLLPKFKRDEDDPKTSMRLLDLDLKLFLKLCPRREDLRRLAHIRCVDTTNKVPSEMVVDGEFSVLVANRFPQPGANTVHLISLEGWNELIDAPDTQFHAASRVRLITMASWSFVSDSMGHDTFGGLMQRLRKNAKVFGVALPAPTSDSDVNRALAHGYVPIDYQPIESTPTFAWYRGPLAPLVRQRLKQPPFQRADSALIFDDGLGLMDVSYAAAWQLGRLQALASPAFSKGLRLFVESYQNAAEFARQINAFFELHRSAFPTIETNKAVPEQVAIADELVQWLARLVLLYPVPFHYLVPHQALLPMESLRFFHLDDNWIDALVDGALSIAVRSLADKDKDVASREDLQSALSKIVYQYRLRLQGKRPEENPSERYMDIPKSGFLLRSSIVTSWPGVEVTVTTDDEFSEKNIPAILRLDQIADGVLFCLASVPLKQVTFREPREGTTFGVNSDGIIETRKDGKICEVKKHCMRAEARNGVVNIAALCGKLAELEKLSDVGSGEFALQMLNMPEKQDVTWD